MWGEVASFYITSLQGLFTRQRVCLWAECPVMGLLRIQSLEYLVFAPVVIILVIFMLPPSRSGRHHQVICGAHCRRLRLITDSFRRLSHDLGESVDVYTLVEHIKETLEPFCCPLPRNKRTLVGDINLKRLIRNTDR